MIDIVFLVAKIMVPVAGISGIATVLLLEDFYRRNPDVSLGKTFPYIAGSIIDHSRDVSALIKITSAVWVLSFVILLACFLGLLVLAFI